MLLPPCFTLKMYLCVITSYPDSVHVKHGETGPKIFKSDKSVYNNEREVQKLIRI